MKHWRIINIRNQKYRWRYFYDHLDFSNYPFSYIIICLCNNHKKEIKIVFHKLGPPMLLPGEKGEPANRNGKPLYINLNEPKYAKEIMEYLFNQVVDFNAQDKWFFHDGEKLLRQLGYILGD